MDFPDSYVRLIGERGGIMTIFDGVRLIKTGGGPSRSDQKSNEAPCSKLQGIKRNCAEAKRSRRSRRPSGRHAANQPSLPLEPVRRHAAVKLIEVVRVRIMTKYSKILQGIGCLFLVCFHIPQVTAEPPKSRTVEQAYPFLASNILKSAKMLNMEKGLLLKLDEMEIPESHLTEIVGKAEPSIRPELRKNLFFLLEQETVKKILVRAAKHSGISLQGLNDEQAIHAYLNHLVQGVTVSEMEAKAFYEENKELVGGVSFEQVKEAIQQVLLEQKKARAVDDHIQDLVRRADININEKWVKDQYALAMDNPVDKARISGKPTMAEFGATGCIPCDMMQPILDKLRKNYPDKLNVVFVHVREKPIMGARFGIRSIPVQVFFDRDGKEVFRHVGFFPESKVTKQLKTMGVQ